MTHTLRPLPDAQWQSTGPVAAALTRACAARCISSALHAVASQLGHVR
eukprot:CAMPEP_0174335694 /NCGR_PEP_ID=MMETSP0810-20121108/20998_1 /TAXON_ID=73025 ORGANISM="Eutreptiella gymnastica-like, Strain CCMP1594" /NCGR_SAMPLE_ID=MMETSP0810 /ASSEMBLY_ACC=CAM_ASM_000659 /LENGTH=47 /DNA_ID= /DNA_START= /DNA_END= /DNA_ORIENTATION=